MLAVGDEILAKRWKNIDEFDSQCPPQATENFGPETIFGAAPLTYTRLKTIVTWPRTRALPPRGFVVDH